MDIPGSESGDRSGGGKRMCGVTRKAPSDLTDIPEGGGKSSSGSGGGVGGGVGEAKGAAVWTPQDPRV